MRSKFEQFHRTEITFVQLRKIRSNSDKSILHETIKDYNIEKEFTEVFEIIIYYSFYYI